MGLFSFLNKGKQDADDELDVPVAPRRRSAKAKDEEPIDPMLPEKKRARRRLIGATALVLAAIIGLPMIFDSQPKPLTDDIAIQIPSRDKAGASVGAPALPLPPAPDASDEPPKTVAAPSLAPKADKPEPPTEKLPAAEPLRPAPEKLAEKQTEKQAEKQTDKQIEKPAAEKPATDKDKPAADKSKASRFVLQVAAVGNKAKAEELQNRLKQAGIKSYSQKVSTKDGDRYRIRVGPFGSREEADKMRARLSKMGLSSAVQPV